jgi:hypothetical protein
METTDGHAFIAPTKRCPPRPIDTRRVVVGDDLEALNSQSRRDESGLRPASRHVSRRRSVAIATHVVTNQPTDLTPHHDPHRATHNLA